MATLKIHSFKIAQLKKMPAQVGIEFVFSLTRTATEKRLNIPFHTTFFVREMDGRFRDALPMVTNWDDTGNDPFREEDDDHVRRIHDEIYRVDQLKKKILLSIAKSTLKRTGEVGNEEYYLYAKCIPDLSAGEAFSRVHATNLA